MLDEKLIWVIFLEFKMGGKAVVTTPNINNTFSPGTANKSAVHSWFKKFYKGDESHEDEEHSGRPMDVDMTNWDQSPKLILLELQEKLLKNSTSTILWSFGMEANGKDAKAQ